MARPMPRKSAACTVRKSCLSFGCSRGGPRAPRLPTERCPRLLIKPWRTPGSNQGSEVSPRGSRDTKIGVTDLKKSLPSHNCQVCPYVCTTPSHRTTRPLYWGTIVTHWCLLVTKWMPWVKTTWDWRGTHPHQTTPLPHTPRLLSLLPYTFFYLYFVYYLNIVLIILLLLLFIFYTAFITMQPCKRGREGERERVLQFPPKCRTRWRGHTRPVKKKIKNRPGKNQILKVLCRTFGMTRQKNQSTSPKEWATHKNKSTVKKRGCMDIYFWGVRLVIENAFAYIRPSRIHQYAHFKCYAFFLWLKLLQNPTKSV